MISKAIGFGLARDGTQSGIAQQLVDAGVPKSDIVLGYRSPFVRQFTGFAVGVEQSSNSNHKQ
ncbi:element excision factor XisI family protein [Microseira wollei]|uniref:element excision factor XisI family protein n=1 Tax=Microseira wollei TaxID=467598 RepID=UPI0021F5F98F|nr:element excision factor XisI family protein [Microseira wollei]